MQLDRKASKAALNLGAGGLDTIVEKAEIFFHPVKSLNNFQLVNAH